MGRNGTEWIPWNLMERNGMETKLNGMAGNGTERNGIECVTEWMQWNGMDRNDVDGMVERIGLERYAPYFAEHCGLVLVPYSGSSSQAPAAGPGLRFAGESVFVVGVVVDVVGLGWCCCLLLLVSRSLLKSRSPWSHEGTGAPGRSEKPI